MPHVTNDQLTGGLVERGVLTDLVAEENDARGGLLDQAIKKLRQGLKQLRSALRDKRLVRHVDGDKHTLQWRTLGASSVASSPMLPQP
jgi:hypothetical protein